MQAVVIGGEPTATDKVTVTVTSKVPTAPYPPGAGVVTRTARTDTTSNTATTPVFTRPDTVVYEIPPEVVRTIGLPIAEPVGMRTVGN